MHDVSVRLSPGGVFFLKNENPQPSYEHTIQPHSDKSGDERSSHAGDVWAMLRLLSALRFLLFGCRGVGLSRHDMERGSDVAALSARFSCRFVPCFTSIFGRLEFLCHKDADHDFSACMLTLIVSAGSSTICEGDS